MTAETFSRINQLYMASAQLALRAERHYGARAYAKGRRAEAARHRMALRAHGLMFDTLSLKEKIRWCEHANAKNRKVAA